MQYAHLAICLFIAAPSFAQEITREELSRADAPGSDTHEVIVSRLTVPPGAAIPAHRHAGDEYVTILEGGSVSTPSGEVRPFPTGATIRFEAGMTHGGLTNSGDTTFVVITTQIVDKGQPLNLPPE